MGILSWLIVGLISGWFVHAAMKRSDGRVLADQLLGAVGALAAGLIGSRLFGIPDSIEGFNLIAILFSCAGAVVLVACVDAWSIRRVAR